MGILNNFKEKTKKEIEKQAKKAVKNTAFKALSSLVTAAIPIVGPVILAASAGLIIYGLIDLGIELFTAKNNPELLYKSLEIDDVSEIVEIKGDEKNGYYLDFVDGIDEKLEKIIEKYNKSAEYHNLPEDVNFLKKILKAEIITQFPDLKGSIPSDSKDGFQGAISIRRVTPNKSLRRNEKYR